jgi:hypothetical protein
MIDLLETFGAAPRQPYQDARAALLAVPDFALSEVVR